MTTECRQLAGLTTVTASLTTLTAHHNSDDMAHNAPQNALVSRSASGPTTTSNIKRTLKLPNLQLREITNASSSPSTLLKTSQDLGSRHELSFSSFPYFVTTSAMIAHHRHQLPLPNMKLTCRPEVIPNQSHRPSWPLPLILKPACLGGAEGAVIGHGGVVITDNHLFFSGEQTFQILDSAKPF